ncbi:MAG: hypothetical protein KAR07_11025 [Spirochaetes bacterium]|nr:hypothetical protein [Spirochaetota bacterium]
MKNKILILTEKNKFHKFDTFLNHNISVDLKAPSKTINPEDYSLVFIRSKNIDVLNFLKNRLGNMPVINSIDSILLSLDRFKVLSAAARNGVKIPRQFKAGGKSNCKVIQKNVIDITENKPMVHQPGSWNKLVLNTDEELYAQEYIESEWEYKIYLAFSKVWCFKQKPTHLYPDKMSTRIKIDSSAAPVEQARAAADAAGLILASVDFLERDGSFYLTDINSTPGIQHIEGGYANIIPDIIEYIYQFSPSSSK